MKISDKAKKELLNIISQDSDKILRVYLAGLGWGGPQLGMVLDEPKDKDVVKEINDIRVSFDDAAFEYAKNLTLNNEDGAFFFEKAGDNGCSSCSSCG